MLSEDLSFPLAPVYDRIVERLYDYPKLAAAIQSQVPPGATVLELCVGTGGLAQAVVERGLRVVGLDASSEMLERARARFAVAGETLELVHDSALDFRLGRTFAGVYVHSGHVLINRRDGRLFVNGVTSDELRAALTSARDHLQPGGCLLLSIEQWEAEGAWRAACTDGDGFWAYADGSWYRRFIVEENDRFGTRMHVFFDATGGELLSEKQVRRPKLSYLELTDTLADVGFDEPRFIPGPPDAADFLLARARSGSLGAGAHRAPA